MSDLQEELRKTRRELAQARRALQERRYARSQPITADLTVQALTTVLQHTIPKALAEAQRDRTRLAEQLRVTQAQLRTAKNLYTEFRYEAWRLAQAGIGLTMNDGDTEAGQGGQKAWSGWGPYSAVYGKNAEECGLVTLA